MSDSSGEPQPKFLTQISRRAAVGGMAAAGATMVAAELGLDTKPTPKPTNNNQNLSWEPIPKKFEQINLTIDPKDRTQDKPPSSDLMPHVPKVEHLLQNPTYEQSKPKTLEEMSGPELLGKIGTLPLRIPKPGDQQINYANYDTILNTSTINPERRKAEQLYVQKVDKGNLDLIDKGLWLISDPDSRLSLIRERHKLRIYGKDTRLQGIPNQIIEWAESKNIHPEMLGICLDARKTALEVISKIQQRTDGFRPNINWKLYIPKNLRDIDPKYDSKDIRPEETMINNGGMAELICQESGFEAPYTATFETKNTKVGQNRLIRVGFLNIGTISSYETVNIKTFPDSQKALGQLAQEFTQQTGIPLNPHEIPGSNPVKGKNGEAQGGDIGIQMTTENTLRIKQICKEVGYTYNPFDPTSAVVGAWVFLALHQDLLPLAGQIDPRKGYLVGDKFEKFRQGALEKWNGNPQEAFAVLSAANSFFDKFSTS